MADLTGQLRIQRQINQLLQARKSLIDDQNKSLSKQALLAKEVAEAMAGKNLEGIQERIEAINRGFSQTADNAEKAARGVDEMTDSIQNADGNLRKFNKNAARLGAAVGFLKGLKKGFGLVTRVASGALRVMGSFVRSVFNISKAILSIPFKIFQGLVDMSQQMGSPVFRQALEEVRKVFGDIASGSGLALRNSVFEMRKEFNGLTGATRRSGASFGRIFGYGREGMAAALKENAELATKLGGSFAQLREELKGNYAELAIYRKGLGFTTDQQALLIKLTAKSGGDIMKRQKDLAQLAAGVGKAFGYSAKEVGTGLGEMFQDVKTFGGFTDKQLVQIRVQAMRLGASMEALAGVSAGFDDYQKAQENVAFLNRNFGMTIDTMKIFREQDPVKRIQMLQRSFAATGRDINSMHRQELQYFSQAVGLNETDAKILFAKKNLSMDYNKVKSVTNKEARKELKTATVLRNLSKQIERIFGSGGEKYKGFFDALGKGFTKGTRRTREFRKVMRNLNRSLRYTDFAGQRLGRNFVKYFPGVREFLGALADFFDPNKLVPTLDKMNKHFKVFFIQMRQGKDPVIAFRTLTRSMMSTLKSSFGEKGEAVELIKTAADQIITIFVNLKLEMYRKATAGAAEGLRGLTTMLKEYNEDPNGAVANAGEKGGEFFGKRFGKGARHLINQIRLDLVPAIKQAAPEIFKAALSLMQMFRDFIYKNKELIVEGIKDTLIFVFKMKLEILGAVASSAKSDPMAAAMLGTMLFGPAIAGALGNYLAIKIGQAIAAAGGRSMLSRIFGANMVEVMTAPRSLAGIREGVARIWGRRGAVGRMAMKAAKVGGVAAMGAAAIASVNGAYKAIQHSLKNPGDAAGAVELGFRSMGSGFISTISLGLIDGEGVINSMFGKFISDPIERELDRMATSGNAAEKALASSAALVEKHANAYLGFAGAANKAKTAADNMGKYFEKDDFADFIDFAAMDAEAEKAARDAQAFSASNVVRMNENLTRLRRDMRNKVHYSRAGAIRTRARTDDSSSYTTFNAFGMRGFREHVLQASRGGDEAAQYLMEAQQKNQIDLLDEAGNFRKTPELEKKIFEFIDSFQDSLAESAREAGRTSRDLTSGRFAAERIFGDGGAEGQRRAEAYQRYQQQQLDQMIAAGADEAAIETARGKMRAFQAQIQTMMVQEAEASYSPQQAEAELRAGIAAYKEAKGLSATAVLEEGIMSELENQAKQRLIAAFMQGDVSALIDPTTKSEIMSAMEDQGLGGRIQSAQEAKLGELEAVASTIARIKKLEGLPEQLKSLQAKIGSISSEKVKEMAKQLVDSAVTITTAFSQAAAGKLDQAQEVQVHASFLTLIDSVRRVAEGVNVVIGQASVDPRTMATRVTRFKNGVVKMHEAMQELGTKTLTESEQKNIGILAIQMPRITEAVVGSIPEGLSAKLTKAKSAIKTAQEMADSLKTIGGGTVEGTVSLVEAINAGGTLTVEMGSTPGLNAQINVTIDSSQLAEAMAVTTFNTGQGYDQFRTFRNQYGFDNRDFPDDTID